MSSEDKTCPFIITKGLRKGLICGEKIKNSDHTHCRIHLRNIGVKMGNVSHSRSRSTDDLSNVDTIKPRPLNDLYKPKIVEHITVKKIEPDKKKSFVTAFSKSIDKKIEEQDTIDMNDIYNEVDVADDVAEEDIPIDSEDPKVTYYKKELENARAETLKAQKRINSMFTMKQLLFTGVKTVADVGEKVGGSNMEGYSSAVMTSDAVNSLLDEMSEDLETIIGFTELPASVRLLATMGIIGTNVYARNTTGLSAKDINPDFVPKVKSENVKEVDDQHNNEQPKILPRPNRFAPNTD